MVKRGGAKRLFPPYEIAYLYRLRKTQCCHNRFMYWVNRWWLRKLSRKTRIQIPAETKIGPGLYIGHTGRIIINSMAILGCNINIGTGVVIGSEARGSREGAPEIGSYVWIGANAVIVGKIKIGSDVLIAPGAYVNFDVPEHSIVIGNPGKIIHKMNAVDGYICSTV